MLTIKTIKVVSFFSKFLKKLRRFQTRKIEYEASGHGIKSYTGKFEDGQCVLSDKKFVKKPEIDSLDGLYPFCEIKKNGKN